MRRCDECKWNYPPELLSPMGASDPKIHGRMVCGICGLAISNAVHGIPRQKFDGSIAESLRQSAIRWRKQHPEAKP